MSKSFYLFIALVLGVSFWELVPIAGIFNSSTVPVMMAVWMVVGVVYFRKLPETYDVFNFSSYRKYYYWLFAGIILSIIPAWFFWKHELWMSVLVNRGLIVYLFIPVLFRIKPTDKDIMRGIVYFAILYMLVWVIQAVLMPIPITMTYLTRVTLGGQFEVEPNEFGMLIPGYPAMLLLLYLMMQQFSENATLKTLIPMVVMYAVFFLLQNRGTLFFASGVMMYVLLMMKSKYKPYHLLLYTLVGIGVLVSTSDTWLALIQETQEQAADLDYNRWKALRHFVFEYSPNWLCYILGNGRFSFHTDAGANILALSIDGYDQTDIGIIGLWSVYGILPVMVIYTIVFRIIARRDFPFYMKALAFHMLMIPIAWNFISGDAMVLVLFIYLYAYYSESSKVMSEQLSS
ncbi:MAG: hypothetical protein RBT57_05380 [Paludibacter sp.]|jgi:hypothetical protein|nr:hypothetical protein [Paludibacter sp.]